MYVYEVDDSGHVEKIEAESFMEAAEVWMAKFGPEEDDAVQVFITNPSGLRRKIIVYAERDITYHARIIE